MSDYTEFAKPQSIAITKHRWHIEIAIVDSEGKTHNFVASADGFFTGNDHIWFSTQAEYDEYREENGW